jgi:NAD+-dependent farnesol dehydrogenase
MRVLVTGGTGYLGQAVVRALASRGHKPVVFARTAASSGLPGLLVAGDIRDRGALERAAAGCDAICHMAALVSIWRRRASEFDEINIDGLRHVIAVTAVLGIPRVLYTSSFLALPPAGRAIPLEANDYQRTKVAAERLAEAAVHDEAPLIRVYPGVVYGPGSLTEGNLVGRLLDEHLTGRLHGLIGPEHVWSFSYVEDVAAAHALALEQGRIGGRYVLGGENATQDRMFAIVERLTGRRPPRRIPYPAATALGALEEWRARLTGGAPRLTRGAVEIFRHDWPLESRAAGKDLGYAATSLSDGLQRTLEARQAGQSQPA